MGGADIANICNQSKINAVKRIRETDHLGENNLVSATKLNQKVSDMILIRKDIQEAIDEVMIGREKRERMLSLEELERVAYHEAGHAFMGFILKNSSPPIKISIIPRGEAALGFSQPKPIDKKLYTKNYIIAQIAVLLGGRVAEKILYDDLSTGASDDIEKISKLIINYNTIWGMNSELGPLNI